ncbi:MAG: site-specific integrase [Erysipelotrichaceae bacterium]
MAVYQDVKNKTWYVSFPYRDDSGKVKVKTKRGFTLKREAQNYEDDLKKKPEIQTETYDTFEDMLKYFLDSRRGNANDESIHEYDRVARLFFGDLLKKRMSRIKPRDMVEIKSKIAATDYSKRYKNTGLQLLKSISRFANIYYDYPDYAKTITKIKESSLDFKEMQIWTPGQFSLFLNCVDEYVVKAYFLLLFRTGMRRSEGKALLKTDIKNGIVNVDKSIKHFSQGIQPLKTLSSRRKIALDPFTLEFLNPLLELPGEFLFGNHEPIGISTIQRSFTKGIEKCNDQLRAEGKEEIPVIRIHDLRHSHASYLIGQGANIVAVSRRLGHSDVNMTLKVYTHLLMESESKVLQILADI